MFGSWKDDVGEYSRRIWEFWRSIGLQSEHETPVFAHAARLVAITQVSSASVERVFSVVVRIMHACGVSILHDNFITRLMRNINNRKLNIY